MLHIRDADDLLVNDLLISDLPVKTPLWIFGASAGGEIVWRGLRKAGLTISGFVDDQRGGAFLSLPISSTAALAARQADATVVIASQHWRAIGRQLEDLGFTRLIDASPMLRADREARDRAWTADAIRDLASALHAATGATVEQIVSQFPQSPFDLALNALLKPFLTMDRAMPLFIVGTGGPGLRLKRLPEQYSGLFLAGFVDDCPECFIDFVDVCPIQTFLDEEPPQPQPLMILTAVQDPSLAEQLRQRGFTRIVDASPLFSSPCQTRLSSLNPATTAVSLLVSRQNPLASSAQSLAAALPDWEIAVAEIGNLAQNLEHCHGAMVTWWRSGEAPPDSAALAAAIDTLNNHPQTDAVICGPAMTLVDLVFGGVWPNPSAIVFRREALALMGLADSAAPTVNEDQIWLSLLTELSVEFLPSATPILPSPRLGWSDLMARLAALRRLFSDVGFFGADPVLWSQCLIRHFAPIYNALLTDGSEWPQDLILPNRRETLRPLMMSPLSAPLYDTVARLYENRGQIAQALAVWDSAVHFTDPTLDGLACQALLKLPNAMTTDQWRRQRRWAARHADNSTHALPRASTDLLTVGYVCASASAAYFQFQLLPIIEKHDRRRYKVIAYLDRSTAEAAAACDLVRPVVGLSDAAFIETVRQDGVDILVEVTGFSPGHRYAAMGQRCAPIQISYINHTGTCGVPNVDYVLADAIAAPPELQPYYSEEIWRLPGSFFCFDFTRDHFPTPTPPPCLANGHITFGCFASGGKINDPLISLWAKLLKRVPEARLLLCNESLRSAANRAFMERRFLRHGISPDRLTLRLGTDRDTIKRLYSEMDISLDTWPYCGGNTIAESLMAGVPAITMTGETFASRYGASLLTASGCPELIATDPEGYLKIAADLAGNPEALIHYRQTLRQSMYDHGFSDSAAFVKKLEQAYEAMLARASKASTTP